MNMSVVNNYQAIAGIKPPATASVATSQQNPNQTAVTNQKDTATISTQGQALSEDSYYQQLAIQDFLNWKNADNKAATGHAIKPIEQLLPENQKLITQLRTQEKSMSSDEKKLTEYSRIPTIQTYGDKEIFTSARDADKRAGAQSQTMSLQLAYLKKTGRLQDLSDTMTDIHGNGIKPLNTGDTNNTVPERVQDLSNLVANTSVSKFDDPNFLSDYLKLAYDSDYYQQPATTKAPWES